MRSVAARLKTVRSASSGGIEANTASRPSSRHRHGCEEMQLLGPQRGIGTKIEAGNVRDHPLSAKWQKERTDELQSSPLCPGPPAPQHHDHRNINSLIRQRRELIAKTKTWDGFIEVSQSRPCQQGVHTGCPRERKGLGRKFKAPATRDETMRQ